MNRIKIVCVMVLVSMFGIASLTRAETDEQKYWNYVVTQLEHLQQEGGVFAGQLYASDPWNGDYQDRSHDSAFAQYIVNGVGRAVIKTVPGWYRAWASWEDLKYRDQLFSSLYMDPTEIGAGAQGMPFLMMPNFYPTIRLNIDGALLSSSDELWFNGERVWFDGTSWRVSVYKPWTLVGESVEVVWVGHGAWQVPINYGTFTSSPITLNTADMDKTVLAPTSLDAISFLEAGSYLSEDGLIAYTGRYYSQEFGGEVLEFESSFDDEISEFLVVLNGQDSYTGNRVNYFTRLVKRVDGVFVISLNRKQVKPFTYMNVYLVDPRNGCWVWKQFNTEDLWDHGGGKGVAAK